MSFNLFSVGRRRPEHIRSLSGKPIPDQGHPPNQTLDLCCLVWLHFFFFFTFLSDRLCLGPICHFYSSYTCTLFSACTFPQMSWTGRRVHHAASPGILITSTEFCPTPLFEPTRVDISNGAFAPACSLQDSWYAPPASPLPCSPAAAATCPSSAPRCTRRTSCSRRPAGLVWPWAVPGRASRHRCRWRSLGWLWDGWKKKTNSFISSVFHISGVHRRLYVWTHFFWFVFLIGQAGFIWLRVKDDPPSVILL